MIAHLADAEDNSHERVQRMLAEENPQFQDYDEKAWARDRGYRSKTIDDVLRRFCEQRAAQIRTLEALGESGWQRSGNRSSLGAITVASITEHMITHDMMHLGQISDSLLDQ
ncbi:MAG: DinB family protein [Thermomicrobiales bacterium]